MRLLRKVFLDQSLLLQLRLDRLPTLHHDGSFSSILRISAGRAQIARLLPETHFQRRKSTQAKIRSPNQVLRFEPKLGESAKHRLEGDLPLGACQRSAKTEMRSVTERQVAVILARNVKPVRIGEPLGIAIGRSHHCDHGFPLANLPSSQFSVARREARGMLARTFITQHFFYCGRNG